jgi:hypothetical protein
MNINLAAFVLCPLWCFRYNLKIGLFCIAPMLIGFASIFLVRLNLPILSELFSVFVVISWILFIPHLPVCIPCLPLLNCVYIDIIINPLLIHFFISLYVFLRGENLLRRRLNSEILIKLDRDKKYWKYAAFLFGLPYWLFVNYLNCKLQYYLLDTFEYFMFK